MSFNDRNLTPDNISDYLISRGILDKNTVLDALAKYKSLNKSNAFSQYLVEKRLVHENNMAKILDDITGVGLITETRREFTNTKLLDDDIKVMYSNLKNSLKGKEKELAELTQPSQKDIEKFLKDNGIDWQGRRMTKEDKASLIQRVSALTSNSEITDTNGAFVLNWMNDLIDT